MVSAGAILSGPLWLHQIFWYYPINGTVFEKKSLNVKCVFWFYLQLLFETFLILGRNQRYTVMNVKTSSCKVPVFLSDINETWIFSKHFRKSLKYQISSKSVRWEPTCSMRRTDRNDEANSRFLQLFRTRLKTQERTKLTHPGRRLSMNWSTKLRHAANKQGCPLDWYLVLRSNFDLRNDTEHLKQ